MVVCKQSVLLSNTFVNELCAAVVSEGGFGGQSEMQAGVGKLSQRPLRHSEAFVNVSVPRC